MVGLRGSGAQSARKFLKATPTLCRNHAHLKVPPSFVLVQVMLQTLCDSVHVHYFQLAMIVQFYIHNYATGSYEVCVYSTGIYIEQWSCGCNKFNFHTRASVGVPPTTT